MEQGNDIEKVRNICKFKYMIRRLGIENVGSDDLTLTFGILSACHAHRHHHYFYHYHLCLLLLLL